MAKHRQKQQQQQRLQQRWLESLALACLVLACVAMNDGAATRGASGDAHPAEGVTEDAERASGDVLAENITWLRESLAEEKDASRRSEAETLLSVASELKKQPSKNALRQIAKELQVQQKIGA